MTRKWLCFLSFMVLVAATGSPEGTAEDSAFQSRAEAFVAAFNRHAADEMARLAAPDVTIYYVSSGGEVSAGTQGRAALAAEMSSYFEQYPDVRSEIAQLLTSGSRVAFEEKVSWTHDGESRQQSSLAVYEFEEGLLRRAWYFPAER